MRMARLGPIAWALACLCPAAIAVADDALVGVHRAAPQFILEPLPPAHLPVRLESVTLAQTNAVLTDSPPRIIGGEALTITANWTPWTAMDSSVPVRIRLWDAMGLIAREHPFRAGPAFREEAWTVGGAYAQPYTIPGDEIGRAFSGHAYLEVAMETPRSPLRNYEPLLLLPVHIAPLVSEGAISPAIWTRELGGGERVLNRQARLGDGAEFSVDVPEAWRTGNRAIAIASFLSYQSLRQGAAAGEVVLRGPEGETTLPIRAGIETARCDHDAHAPGRLNHDKIRVLMSRDAAQVGYDSRPVQLHTYLAIIDLPPDLGPIDEIVFRCKSAVVLDIMGCGLVPAAP